MKGKKNKNGTFTLTVTKKELDGLLYMTLSQHCSAFVADFGKDDDTPAPYGLVNKKNVEDVLFGLEEGLRKVRYPEDYDTVEYEVNR